MGPKETRNPTNNCRTEPQLRLQYILSVSAGCCSYICDIDLSDGWSSEGAEALSDAADHCTENPQQSCQFGQ